MHHPRRRPLSADPETLAANLVERAADGTVVAALNMACTATRHMHRKHGLTNPVGHEFVRQVRLGLRWALRHRLALSCLTAHRRRDRPNLRRHRPHHCDRSPRRRIILLGYPSAMRGSELVALTLADCWAALPDASPLKIQRVIRRSSETTGNRSETFRYSWGRPMGNLLKNPRFSKGTRELQ